jgi:hypothetical protein
MKRRLTFALSLLVLVAVLTGCVLTELRVTNHTGGQIQVYTGHTKKVKAVPVGATVVVPHTAGRIIIITQNDEVWEYDMVDVPQHVRDVTSGVKKLILLISVESDGTILLPSGTKISPSQKLRAKQ